MNALGLPRIIPGEVKRLVRQRCGFGCVFCGMLPYQYEHFSPEYAKATEHSPDGITLLCPTHHAEKTSGRISPEHVARQTRIRIAAVSAGRGATWSPVIDPAIDCIRLCGLTFEGCERVGLSINGTSVFAMSRGPDGEWALSGTLCDDSGASRLEFVENEVTFMNGAWDTTLEGTHLTIRIGPRKIAAKFLLDARAGVMGLIRLKMSLANGYRIDGDERDLIIGGRRGRVVVFRDVAVMNSRQAGVILVGTATQSDSAIAINIPELGSKLDWTSVERRSDCPLRPAVPTNRPAIWEDVWAGSDDDVVSDWVAAASLANDWIPADLFENVCLMPDGLLQRGLLEIGTNDACRLTDDAWQQARKAPATQRAIGVERALAGIALTLRVTPADSTGFERYRAAKTHYDQLSDWHIVSEPSRALFVRLGIMIATARVQSGDPSSALDCLEASTNTCGDDFETIRLRAHLLGELDRLHEADLLFCELSRLSSDPDSLADVQNDHSTVLCRLGRHEEAEGLLRVSLAHASASQGPSALETARRKNNLASVLQSQERFEEAEALIAEAITVFERERDFARLIVALVNLGAGREAQEKFEDALSIYERARQEHVGMHAGPHRNGAAILSNIAYAYVRLGNDLRARSYYIEALEVAMECLPTGHGEVSRLWICLHDVCSRCGERVFLVPKSLHARSGYHVCVQS